MSESDIDRKSILYTKIDIRQRIKRNRKMDKKREEEAVIK